MHHRGGDENELVCASGERVALLDDDAAVCVVRSKEVLHHREGLGARDDRRLRVGGRKCGYVGAVVRLHVLNDEVVDRRVADLGADVREPGLAEAGVDGIEHECLRVLDKVGIVGHSARHDVLPLEEVYVMIVHADVLDVFGDVHSMRYYTKKTAGGDEPGTNSP